MVVITKDQDYQFQIKSTNETPGTFYNIRQGRIDRRYTIVRKTKRWKLYQGEHSMMFSKNDNLPIAINGKKVFENKVYLSKGGELFIAGERIRR